MLKNLPHEPIVTRDNGVLSDARTRLAVVALKKVTIRPVDN